MHFLKKLKSRILYQTGYYLYRYKNGLKHYQTDSEWNKRINDAARCRDNQHIPRLDNAGLIEGNTQVMHNGVRIKLGSYYGYGYSFLFQQNKGVHEPQEERVFHEVLKYIPEGGIMLELGAFWAFYSMWFHKEVKQAVNYMLEPDYLNLLKGKANFKLNGYKGHFLHAYAGKDALNKGPIPTITVDEFMKKNGLRKLDVLHSDIQGEELNMLNGAKRTFEAGLIDFVFISTHSNELHSECSAFLLQYGFEIIASADLNETFSVDGVLVAKRKEVAGPSFLELDLRKD